MSTLIDLGAVAAVTAMMSLIMAAAYAAFHARQVTRGIRWRVNRCRRRLGPGAPDDGEPLDEAERAALIGIMRGWRKRAPERSRT